MNIQEIKDITKAIDKIDGKIARKEKEYNKGMEMLILERQELEDRLTNYLVPKADTEN